MAFDITEAQLFGLAFECILYGVLLLTSWACVCSIVLEPGHAPSARLRWRDPRAIHWGFLLVWFLLFALGTTDTAMGLRHCLNAFVYYQGPGGAPEYLRDISNPVSVTKIADFVAVAAVGDLVLIYRCYVVFGNSWKVALLPFIIYLGGLACAIVMVVKWATLNSLALITDIADISSIAAAAITISLGVNIISTFLIVWRIWSVDRRRMKLQTTASSITAVQDVTPLQRVIRIFVESALIYCASFIVFEITYVTGNNASYVVSDMCVQIAGICFNLILIRVNLGRSFVADSEASSSNRLSTLRFGSTWARKRTDDPIALSMVPDETIDTNTLGHRHNHSGGTLTATASGLDDSLDAAQKRESTVTVGSDAIRLDRRKSDDVPFTVV